MTSRFRMLHRALSLLSLAARLCCRTGDASLHFHQVTQQGQEIIHVANSMSTRQQQRSGARRKSIN